MGVCERCVRAVRLLFWASVLTFVTAVSVSGQPPSPGAQVWTLGVVPEDGQVWTLGVVPEDGQVSERCRELLRVFGQRYGTLARCLVTSARPVTLCQHCHAQYAHLHDIYTNISADQTGPGNVSCQVVLLRSDRLMLLYNLYSSLHDIWESAECTKCLNHNQTDLNNETLSFLTRLNQSLSCFEKYQQGNHSDLCKECKTTYKALNELYSQISTKKSLCIDIEDAMNMTRQLWSKTFNCSVPREETVPVIAVSSFMLFLPIIFYLSNYLHSEQKKRKLIHAKRAKSSHSLMNIQDKLS
ncbi:osteopetrosis-associated transmembrane protein 1 [Brachyhypopomus gauderio]|uniref:osteopetrosis-associated transmembrane protein 1 n=1 Tax=Brachyhypopomus gauderio TaxID=698409 RepID=UPI0040420D2F